MGGSTLWEQIDAGDQFTPSRKFLTAVPIVLYVSLGLANVSPRFLVSTHYARYTFTMFTVNFIITAVNVFVKLPLMDHVRLFVCLIPFISFSRA